MDSDRRPHICMIVPDPDVHGGIATVTAGYYGSRLERDYRITYVQSYCDGGKRAKLAKALGAYRQFHRVLKKDPPDLVHVHSSFGPSFYRKIPFIEMARHRGIPVVNHIHGSDMDELYHRAPEAKKRLVRRIYGHCDRIIVLAGIWKKEFSRLVPEDRLEIVPNYAEMDPGYTARLLQEMKAPAAGGHCAETKESAAGRYRTETKEPAAGGHRAGAKEPDAGGRRAGTKEPDGGGERREGTLPPGSDTSMHERFARRGLLFLGVITEGKGVRIFPEVMRRVLAELPDVCLTVAGVGDVDSLFAGADPGVMAHIRFTGWVTGGEKEKLLRENAVFLFPSHMECFSMSVLEAQGHGMPVISCHVGSIPEAVEEGKTGFLFDVGDAAGMAEAILRLLRDEPLWRRMAISGVENVRDNYTLERHIGRIEAVYEKVLDSALGSSPAGSGAEPSL